MPLILHVLIVLQNLAELMNTAIDHKYILSVNEAHLVGLLLLLWL